MSFLTVTLYQASPPFNEIREPTVSLTVDGPNYVKESDYYISKGFSGVDFRAKNLEAFDSMEKNSIDLYATVRSLYLQDRQKKIKNSSSKTEAMDDGDWDTLENQ